MLGFRPGIRGSGRTGSPRRSSAAVVIAGAGALLIWIVATVALRNAWRSDVPTTSMAQIRPALAES